MLGHDAPVGGEVLILAHEPGERIVAGGEAWAQLLEVAAAADWFAHWAISNASRARADAGSMLARAPQRGSQGG